MTGPLPKSYLQIEQWQTKGTKLFTTTFKVPNHVEPVKTKRTLTQRKSKLKVGSKGKLPKRQFYAALLMRNEMLGCLGQASDRAMLLRNLRAEYPGWSKKTSGYYIERFSRYRSSYNLGKMYHNQGMPTLYCWYWNANGYIHYPGEPNTYLSFQHCKRKLIQAKFADPRFFDLHEVATMRNLEQEDWHVPLLVDINAIEAEVGKPLYDSITWPEGYSKEYNPI